MKKLLIIGDYNDGDYIKDVIRVEDDVFEKFRPMMEAINNFEPYVCRDKYSGICTHNWISPREDLGEKNIYETYSQFSKEYIEEFIRIFTDGLYSFEDECPCHTIIEISDVVTDEKYVDWNQNYESIQKRYSPKVKEFIQKRSEILEQIHQYTRPDGRCLDDVPFAEMTDSEKNLFEKADNLWKDYQ